MKQEDRINELPEEIRTHILSYLSTNDAMSLSVLSRSWRNMWLRLPYFNMMTENLYSNVLDNKLVDIQDEASRIKVKNETLLTYLNFLERTLKRWSQYQCQSLETSTTTTSSKLFVHLYLPPPVSNTSNYVFREAVSFDLYSLFEYSAKATLELHIHCGLEQDESRYKLLNRVFMAAQCLRRLCLFGLKLESSLLHILATNCPLMHSLEFRQCQWNTQGEAIEVFGFSKLAEFKFDHESISDILLELNDLPNLGLLELDLDSYTSQVSIDDSICSKLKHVTMKNSTLDNERVAKLTSLEYLCLDSCRLGREFHMISSNNLKFLSLCNIDDYEGLLEINVPGLEEFHMLNNKSCWIKLEIIDAPLLKCVRFVGTGFSSFTIKSTNYSPTVLDSASFSDLHCDNDQFIEILSNLNHPRTLEIDYPRPILQPIPEYPPVIYGVKNLKINITFQNYDQWRIFGSILVEVIDFYLWLSPHLDMIYIRFIPVYPMTVDHYELKILQFKYEVDLNTEVCSRCEYLPIRCWQHCLREVVIENKIGSGMDPKLYNEMIEKIPKVDADLKRRLFQRATTFKNIIDKTTAAAGI